MKIPYQYMLFATIAFCLLDVSTTRADEVHATSTIVEGHLCVSDGAACVNPEPYPAGLLFNTDFLVKDDWPFIYMDDTDASAFDWFIGVDTTVVPGVPRGTLSFTNGVDQTDYLNWSAPLVIESDGPSHQLYLDNNGNIGINTNTPSQDLSIASIDPTIALFDTDGPRTWEINSNPQSSYFDIADATAGTSPFVIQATAPDNSLFLNSQGFIGLGLSAPARQLHLRGPNALFRMDRSADTAAFIMVRTLPDGTPLKTFVVGTNASGANNGEFVINDLGTATGGGGARRMTINNSGNVIFTGIVQAPAFTQVSSRKLKDNIVQIDNSLALTEQLQGVRFDWKDSGQPALGFIAEEVAEVLPEVVQHDEVSGEVSAVNYTAIVPLLVEAIKEQQREISALQEQVSEFQSMKARLTELELQIGANQSGTVLVSN